MSDVRHVICLHGIWMPGAGMSYVRKRLVDVHGFEATIFDYAAVAESLDANAEKLAETVRAVGETVHLVGHSLGGVLSVRMLANHPDIPVERIVCLGSPLCGSRAAEGLNRSEWGRFILGKTITEGVVHEAAISWGERAATLREIGVVAGDAAIGVGQLVAKFDEPNDGAVAVSETRLPGARDHVVLNVNHTGMLLSSQVVDQAAAFLKNGQFRHET